jgi:hypothetical protein
MGDRLADRVPESPAKAARRRRRTVAVAVGVPVVAAVAVLAVALLGPSRTVAVVPVPPATQEPSQEPTPPSASGRPSVDQPVPTAAVVRLKGAVHQLSEAVSGRPAALQARLIHYQVDSQGLPAGVGVLPIQRGSRHADA